MGEETSYTSSELGYPMNGGVGECSYFINSTRQRSGADGSREVMVAAIVENLGIENLSKPTFRIADLGCSVGPNTFISVNNIIEAVAQKEQLLQSQSGLPEFEVYFSDVVSNDFNHLFTNLPPDRHYFAVGVPGSFHGRLFPKASLDIVHSAYALQWLSKIPRELVDSNSPACNKGRILYAYSAKEVGEAYRAQYAKDMQHFLGARAQEIAPHGLIILLHPGRPDGTVPAQHSFAPHFEPLESCLSDMVNEGLISQDKFDYFNLPMYCPSMEELGTLIKENGWFDILRMEVQPLRTRPLPSVLECRAGLENILSKHFGNEIMQPLVDRYSKKIAGRAPLNASNGMAVGLLVILKRKNIAQSIN